MQLIICLVTVSNLSLQLATRILEQNRDFRSGQEDICLLLEEVGSSTSGIHFSSKSDLIIRVVFGLHHPWLHCYDLEHAVIGHHKNVDYIYFSIMWLQVARTSIVTHLTNTILCMDCINYKQLQFFLFSFRSESASQVFIIVLSWLFVILKSLNPANWSKVFVAYDNMCHLDGLWAARNCCPGHQHGTRHGFL